MLTEKNSYGDHLQNILSFYGDLLEDKCYSGLIIPSGIPKKRFLDDNVYPFKVNIHFSAILPVTDAPHSYIIFQSGKKPVLAYYQPEDYWHVVPSDPEGFWVEYFDIHVFRGVDDWQK
ncbi:MAG: Xaa-Pro dipeptidase, partial [Gammaproteobacteria bacterium]|nr:Xaa-Pro dipeptidase [Gammaproteobacteria bacterium]